MIEIFKFVLMIVGAATLSLVFMGVLFLVFFTGLELIRNFLDAKDITEWRHAIYKKKYSKDAPSKDLIRSFFSVWFHLTFDGSDGTTYHSEYGNWLGYKNWNVADKASLIGARGEEGKNEAEAG